jgi:hypothetical protein
MPRFTLATLLALGALSPGQAVSQELPPNLITGAAPVSISARPDGRALLELADQALGAGLSSTAAGFYSQLLADPKLDEPARELAGLGLTAATLERARVPETKAALKFLPKSSRKTLREGLVALLENDLDGAARLSGELKVTDLPSHETAWGHALRWMIAVAKGDNLNATLSQEAIARTAVSEEQRQRIELLGYRATILAGKVEDRTIQVLRELAEEARGTPLAFAYARNLALAYAQRRQPEDAAKALAAAGSLAPARQAEADLLAGLILGADAPAGRARLKEAARNPANVAVRLTALRALVAAATPPPDNRPEKLLEARAVANEVNDFLLRQNPGSLTYHCPRDPQVLDAIHLARAQLMLFAGSREKARQASEDLLRDVPASPLAREATRTLAIAAWGDGSFRLAATHLATLADSSVEPERAGLRIAAADCLFLAKDFALSEKAYANLQQEAADIRLSEDAFHQRVLCLLETSDDAAAWDRVATVIEETARTRRTRTALPLWSASWSLVEDARKSGRAAEAEKLLVRLRPLLAEARADYALRFAWQSALLAIAQGRLAQAGQLAQEIDRRLEDIPKDDALSDLRKAAPSCRATPRCSRRAPS